MIGGDMDRFRKCFMPRQWFLHDGEPDPGFLNDEEVFMWVYREWDGKFQVGYFLPDKTWFTDGTYITREEAVKRVNYLNGGKGG